VFETRSHRTRLKEDAMSPIFKSTAFAAMALTAGLIVATEASARKKPPRDTATGTHREEYLENTRPPASGSAEAPANAGRKAQPTTSTGRELNGPGTHHSEYGVPPEQQMPLRVDTVHDRRLWLTEDGDTLSGDTVKARRR
jgi:hypothetical protein